MRIVSRDEIQTALAGVDLMQEIEHGFVAYSRGEAVVPPVGELLFRDPPGEVHLKYGYIKGDAYYVIKIASGFSGNPATGLPASNGMMLMFSQQTGEPVAALLDEGLLTDIRTAVAGAIAARHLAVKDVKRIGIIGTGRQARLQLQYLLPVTACRDVLLWGRHADRLAECAVDVAAAGFNVATTADAADIARTCTLIVTTTAACEPILSGPLLPGTHVTAMGSDTHEKQEVAVDVLAKADLKVADSISQCLIRGEIHQALRADAIRESDIIELGSIIAGDASGRTSELQITVADLTGVAVQDIQIATAVFAAL